MAMYQGLDLSRFKKVGSDKKTTTLRHAKGHEIRIAHSGLTPKMREMVDALEKHEDPKMMAGGGRVDDDKMPDLDPASPEPITEEAPVPAALPVDRQANPQSLTPNVTGPDDEQPQQVAQDTAVPPKPAVMPVAATVDVQGQRPQRDPKQIAQEMTDHDLTFQKDMAMGRIKPQTYHDLYEKKDTLGKIGTIFGLLLGGAGAGLAHGPNQALEMMNREIQNDFEAQKQTQSNAQNWYQQTLAHEMQKAQMGQMNVQNMNTLTQMGKVPSEIKEAEARTRGIDADTLLKSSAQAINMMKIGAVQSLQDQANKMAPGPQKDEMQKAVDQVNSAVQQDISLNNQKTADQIAARDKLRGEAEPDPNSNGIDQDKFNRMIAQSRANEALGAPSMMNESDIGRATQEAERVADNRAMARIYKDSFNKLNSKIAGGALNPQLRAAELASLGAEIARATAGRFNAAEAAAQADGMFPSAKDWGGSREEKYRKSMEYFENQEAGTTTLNRLGLKTPFPFSPKKTASGAKSKFEGKTIVDKNGNRQTMKNGKWTPAGQSKQATK